MKIIQFVLLCALIWPLPGVAQSGADFDRKALSFVWGIPPDLQRTYQNWTQLYATVPLQEVQERFDRIALSQRVISMTQGDTAVTTSTVQEALMASGLPNEVMGKIWSRKSDGRLGFEYLQARAEKTLTDHQRQVMGQMHLGNQKVLDFAESLIEQTYIVVMVPADLQTMEEFYNGQDAKARKRAEDTGNTFTPIERKKEGYMGKVLFYVFQVEFADVTKDYFYNTLWVDQNTPSEERVKRKAQFDAFQFQVEYVTTVRQLFSNVEGTQSREIQYDRNGSPLPRKTPEQLYTLLMTKGWNTGLIGLNKLFVLRQSLFAVDPPRAKLGEKEGLLNDRRFHVYEYRLRPNGKERKKRMGVIRSTNKQDVSTTRSGGRAATVFYQTSGKRLDQGMLVEEKPRFGVGASYWAGMGRFGGSFFRADVRLSMLHSQYLASNVGFELPPGLVLGLGLSLGDPNNYQIAPSAELDEQSKWVLDVTQNFHPHRRLIVQPSWIIGVENSSGFRTERVWVTGPGFGIGTPLGANTQLLLGMNYMFTFGSDNEYYLDKRHGLTLGMGIHFDFPI